jgi:hypothetical protein
VQVDGKSLFRRRDSPLGFRLGNTAGDNIFVFGILEKASAEIRRQEIGKGKKMALDLGKLKSRERDLLQKKAKLESDLARLQKTQKDAARKADSRQKIILGGVLIAAVRDGGIPESLVRRLVQTHASDRDKKVFEDFVFETPAAETAAAESYGAGQPSGE